MSSDTADEPSTRRWELQVLTPGEAQGGSFKNRGNWAIDGQEQIPEGSVLWKQYEVLVGLYRYYLDVAWKVSVWYYATTGLILSYFFEHVGDDEGDVLPLVLVFVGCISLGFAYLTWRGGGHLFGLINLLESIAKRLKLPGRPHVEFACVFLLINTLMFVLVSVCAFWMYFYEPWDT
jgi:hypothetical protein